MMIRLRHGTMVTNSVRDDDSSIKTIRFSENRNVYFKRHRIREKMTSLTIMLGFCSISSLTSASSLEGTDPYCGPGQFRNGSVCQTCPDDTYMDEREHVNKDCKPCTQYDEHIDRVADKEPCTRQRNTVIKSCSDGFEIFKSWSGYGCRLCQTEDCRKRRQTTTPDATSEPNAYISTPEPQTTESLPSTASFSDYTNCNEVIGHSSGSLCLRNEFVNQSCVFGDEPLTELLPCQRCPQIARTNAPTCQPVPTEDNASLRPGDIAGIVCGTVLLLLIFFGVGFYCWRSKKSKKHYHIYSIHKSHALQMDAEKSAPDALVENGTIPDGTSTEEAVTLV
ncbi:hypothetical protein Btru_039813 [Bulinus truncatus]|nr:hypothetical protein Btru_039813 [Bulinus truncatus]